MDLDKRKNDKSVVFCSRTVSSLSRVAMKERRRCARKLTAMLGAFMFLLVIAGVSNSGDGGEYAYATHTVSDSFVNSITTSKNSWGIPNLNVPFSEAGAIDSENAKEVAANNEPENNETDVSRSYQRVDVSELLSNNNVAPDEKHLNLVNLASSYQGNPYLAGGNQPMPGWDCSGFVQWVYAQFGVSLPHGSAAQMGSGVQVSPDQAMPGDIVASAGHAAIYIGNGMVVNAMNPYLGTGVSDFGVFYSPYVFVHVNL
jgi:cell wall-associated NlpC family hydrolase